MARCSDCQKKHEDLFEIYKTEIDFMQQMLVGFFFAESSEDIQTSIEGNFSFNSVHLLYFEYVTGSTGCLWQVCQWKCWKDEILFMLHRYVLVCEVR